MPPCNAPTSPFPRHDRDVYGINTYLDTAEREMVYISLEKVMPLVIHTVIEDMARAAIRTTVIQMVQSPLGTVVAITQLQGITFDGDSSLNIASAFGASFRRIFVVFSVPRRHHTLPCQTASPHQHGPAHQCQPNLEIHRTSITLPQLHAPVHYDCPPTPPAN